ncbi:uncharacterized protein LOC105780177 isoform X5 [Gossypium raimondii]|uniref:uncharacterized protein LOC105780177 isoform X5 n=1 Tax=Gossypium raimondii TaxID=29730 RepID=UPI00063AF04B|nr:uncharacterized protein LOC105780177 isoform X5 [Gossypium raimondii]XP_012459814.1 uncharacterized protein LOC105780177 isoform X5 [Gossypium raimondii]
MADFFSLPLDDAASTLGVCTSVLKKICRENGLDRWLHCKPDAGLAAAILMQNLSRISMNECSSTGCYCIFKGRVGVRGLSF